MQVRSLIGIWFILTLSLAGHAYGQSAFKESAFKDGQAAFKRGDYAQAVEYFQQAERQTDSSAVQYNLGVSYYRLGQFDNAKRHFMRLTEDARWQDLARYNLGLIAERQGDQAQARRWFAQVQSQSSQTKLRNLAARKLRILDPEVAAGDAQASTRAKDWLVLLSVGAGYDDNAASLADELSSSSSDAEDSFTEYLAYGQTYLSGHRKDGIKLYGLGYTQQYSDFDDFDVSVVSAGVTREAALAGYDTEIGLMAARSEIGSEHLANQYQLRLQAARSVGANDWALLYRPSYFDASSRYAQVEGWQHRVELSWKRRFGDVRTRVRYRLEYNDRDDLVENGNFFSYSPLRNGLLADLRWQFASDWQLTADAKYFHDEYDGTNRFTDIDGVFKVRERDNDHWEVGIGLAYSLTPNWSLKGEYRYADRQSNFRLYQYDKSEVKVAVEFLY